MAGPNILNPPAPNPLSGTPAWQANPLPDAPGAQPYRSTGQKLLDYALHDSLPAKAVQSAWSGLTAPGDAWAGKIAPEDMQGRASDMAALMTGGAGVVPAEGEELRAGIAGWHGSPKTDIEQFRTRNERLNRVQPSFFAMDEGTPRAEQYASGYLPSEGGGAMYHVDINPTGILDARNPEHLQLIRDALDTHSTQGAYPFLEGNRDFQQSGLPGWGNDALYHALDAAGHKGVVLDERPDVRSVAVFDPTAINILSRQGR